MFQLCTIFYLIIYKALRDILLQLHHQVKQGGNHEISQDATDNMQESKHTIVFDVQILSFLSFYGIFF